MKLAPPPWLEASIEAVERSLGSIEPPLAGRLSRLGARIARINGGRSLLTSLCGAASTPFPFLLEGLRADVGLPLDDPRVALVGEGAVLLYFYVRLQDDVVDEPALCDRADVYAMEVLSSASERAFACAVDGAARFFQFKEEVMRSFATVAAWEVDVYCRGGGCGDAEARLGGKFLPMAVPLGALALAGGRPALLSALAGFVSTLGCALQLINDVLNVGEDHANGRDTPVLRSLREGGRLWPGDPPPRARALLLSDPALDRALDQARARVDEAERAAIEMGASSVAAVVRERAGFLDTVPDRLLMLALSGGAF